jgi:hypothetical protein
MGVLDLKGQLGFYGSYHNNKWNKLIHIVFVPTIVWTALVFLAALGPVLQHQQQLDSLLPFFTPLSRSLPTALQPYFSFNYGLPFVLFYSTYYILLEPFAGVSFLSLSLPRLSSSFQSSLFVTSINS